MQRVREIPITLERPLLATKKALIDVQSGEVPFQLQEEKSSSMFSMLLDTQKQVIVIFALM